MRYVGEKRLGFKMGRGGGVQPFESLTQKEQKRGYGQLPYISGDEETKKGTTHFIQDPLDHSLRDT